MVLLDSTWLYCLLPKLYFTLPDSLSWMALLTLRDSIGYSTIALVDSILLYHDSSALLDSTFTYLGSSSLYLTLLPSTMGLLWSTLLYHGSILHSTWLYCLNSTLALLHSTWPILLFHGFPSVYIHYSTMVLLHSTWLYIILPRGSTVPDSIIVFHRFISLYITLLYSTYFYIGSASLYLTLLAFTMALLYFTLPDTITEWRLKQVRTSYN